VTLASSLAGNSRIEWQLERNRESTLRPPDNFFQAIPALVAWPNNQLYPLWESFLLEVLSWPFTWPDGNIRRGRLTIWFRDGGPEIAWARDGAKKKG
jgi:hypothetical protein